MTVTTQPKPGTDAPDQLAHALLENAPIGLVLWCPDGVLVEANRVFAEMVGYTADELRGSRLRELLFDPRHADEHASFSSIEFARSVGPYEMELCHKQGFAVPVRFNGARFDRDGQIYVWSTIEDNRDVKRVVDALRESESTFRDLTEKSLVGVYLVLGDVFAYVNPCFAEIFGYRVDELLYKLGPRDLTHPDDWERSRENLRKRFAGEVPSVHYTIRALRKNGVVINVELYGSRTTYRGNPAIIGTVLDVTEQNRAAEELLRSERDFRRIIDNMIDTFYRTDTEGRIVLASPSASALLGWTVGELIGTRLADLYVDPHGREKFLQKLQEGGGQVVGYEAALYRKDGSEVWVETNAHYYRDDAGAVRGVEGTVRNITDRKYAEQALRDSEERFRSLHQMVSTGIGIHDQGLILDANLSLARITGFELDELIGMDGLLLIAPEQREAARARIRSGYEKPYLSTGLRKDGTTYPLEIAGRNMTYRGRAVRMTEFRDITERVRAQKETEKLQRQLQQAQKVEALGQLTGGIAHDFNNIIASILGYSRLALALYAKDTDAKVAEFLGQIAKAGERAARLVDQMLVFSRGGGSEAQPLVLTAVLDETLEMLRPTLPSTLEISTVLERSIPRVNADPVALQQVIMNLCINARDAMSERGRLELRIGPVAVASCQCGSCHADFAGSFVELTVTDDGAGIHREHIDHIFDPFFTTKDVGKGTGMGLSVVHGIVHRFGGHVLVESAPGQGCKVRVLLPAVAAVAVEAERPDTPRATTDRRSTPANILVVDDDALLCRFFAEMLGSIGYRVTAETDPLAALRAFEKDPYAFDLVLTDQTMPGISGKELARKLLGMRSGLPVIMCTGYSEHLDEAAARALGAAAFFTKPVDMGKMLETIADLLRSRRAG